MKILVLGNRIPWPLHDGGAIASYAMLRALSGAGIALHFCSFNTKKHFVSQELCNKHFGFCTVKTIPLDSSLSVWGACKNLFLGKSYHISRYECKEANDIVEALLHEQRFDLVLFEETTVHVIDFKTDNPNTKATHKTQLLIYMLALSQLYPTYTIKASLYFTQSNRLSTLEWNDNDIQTFSNTLKTITTALYEKTFTAPDITTCNQCPLYNIDKTCPTKPIQLV